MVDIITTGHPISRRLKSDRQKRSRFRSTYICTGDIPCGTYRRTSTSTKRWINLPAKRSSARFLIEVGNLVDHSTSQQADLENICVVQVDRWLGGKKM